MTPTKVSNPDEVELNKNPAKKVFSTTTLEEQVEEELKVSSPRTSENNSPF